MLHLLPIYNIAKHFIGEPQHFQDRSLEVRKKLKDRFEEKITYEKLTYGDLISFINITGLELCTNMKLKNQLKKDNCGYTKLYAHSNEVSKKVKHHRKTYKDKHDKHHYYKRIPRKSKLDNSNTNTYWNCGKIGHHARDCRAPNKKNDKVNMLELEDEIKNKFYSILDENQTSSEGSSSEEDKFNIIYSSE
ncbi:hypothetical protein H5410_021345, partial [Solanum commersonii]